ncbi:MAG: hypothetical protein JWQ25_1352 [Daejeonella sp.]|nr:hypothetical protein [Daejeonella sp.]
MVNELTITTGDLKREYEIIGPVYFSVNNTGIFKNKLALLIEKYENAIKSEKEAFAVSRQSNWEVLLSEALEGKNLLDKAFYISLMELKAKAILLKADAIIELSHNLELPTASHAFLQMQMYGTAVRFNK